MTDNDLQLLNNLDNGLIKSYNLESILNDCNYATFIRRIYFSNLSQNSFILKLPFKNYPFDQVYKQCCESVIGYANIPIGLAGPCIVNDQKFWIPLATTEGCLVASINRGFSALKVNINYN